MRLSHVRVALFIVTVGAAAGIVTWLIGGVAGEVASVLVVYAAIIGISPHTSRLSQSLILFGAVLFGSAVGSTLAYAFGLGAAAATAVVLVLALAGAAPGYIVAKSR